jgi:hypothetical protein
MIMRSPAICIALLVTAAGGGLAQTANARPEIRAFTGAQIATGAQRNLFSDNATVGVEAAVELQPTVHMVASLGWVPSRTTYSLANNSVNIFQYTLGLEVGLARLMPGAWIFKPFIGAGAGARTYAYTARGIRDQTCSAGYGAAGAEFQLAKTALRLEARDNVFCYQSPIAGVAAVTRNDVGLTLGVAYHIR